LLQLPLPGIEPALINQLLITGFNTEIYWKMFSLEIEIAKEGLRSFRIIMFGK
jgi:hypothetical protein